MAYDNTYDLSSFAQGFVADPQQLVNCLEALRSNFATSDATNFPDNAIAGQCRYNTTTASNPKIEFYNGAAWVDLASILGLTTGDRVVTQTFAATTLATITHNLGRRPFIFVALDGTGTGTEYLPVVPVAGTSYFENMHLGSYEVDKFPFAGTAAYESILKTTVYKRNLAINNFRVSLAKPFSMTANPANIKFKIYVDGVAVSDPVEMDYAGSVVKAQTKNVEISAEPSLKVSQDIEVYALISDLTGIVGSFNFFVDGYYGVSPGQCLVQHISVDGVFNQARVVFGEASTGTIFAL